tara:strand:+ start:221 stop:535 length:315 start_codon:yes stop_codon:yes gene_type:complete
LILSFETKLLRDVCERAECAERELGAAASAQLFDRIADMVAAPTASDFLFGQPVSDDAIYVALGANAGLKFVSNHAEHNANPRSRVDWSQVKRVRIVEISSDAK